MNGSSCQGKELNDPNCHAGLTSTCYLEAVELKGSSCWGDKSNVSCCLPCLLQVCSLGGGIRIKRLLLLGQRIERPMLQCLFMFCLLAGWTFRFTWLLSLGQSIECLMLLLQICWPVEGLELNGPSYWSKCLFKFCLLDGNFRIK